MSATEMTRHDRLFTREGTLRDCALVILATTQPGCERGYLIQLDRGMQTYCRSLTPAEVAALARMNPDDGIPEAALGVICDLTMALATLCGTGAVIARRDGRNFIEFAPLSPREFGELGRIASALLAALGSVGR